MSFVLAALLSVFVMAGLVAVLTYLAVGIMRSKKTVYSWGILVGALFFLGLIVVQSITFFF